MFPTEMHTLDPNFTMPKSSVSEASNVKTQASKGLAKVADGCSSSAPTTTEDKGFCDTILAGFTCVLSTIRDIFMKIFCCCFRDKPTTPPENASTASSTSAPSASNVSSGESEPAVEQTAPEALVDKLEELILRCKLMTQEQQDALYSEALNDAWSRIERQLKEKYPHLATDHVTVDNAIGLLMQGVEKGSSEENQMEKKYPHLVTGNVTVDNLMGRLMWNVEKGSLEEHQILKNIMFPIVDYVSSRIQGVPFCSAGFGEIVAYLKGCFQGNNLPEKEAERIENQGYDHVRSNVCEGLKRMGVTPDESASSKELFDLLASKTPNPPRVWMRQEILMPMLDHVLSLMKQFQQSPVISGPLSAEPKLG